MATANGAIDLTNCDREPIHLLGAVQPFGFLLGVSRPSWVVTWASANVAEWRGIGAADVIGHPMDRSSRQRPSTPSEVTCKAPL
jgi:light-regulated signal transduction histidine kinase (bacteriophytochrome)